MTTQSSAATTPTESPMPYRQILVALDSSDHSNQAITEAVALATLSDAEVTATHVYAAKLHDVRFRQMEGGLPERYREEQVLEEQRDVHDDLITRGLSIITDSYLDQAERICKGQSVRFTRRSLEGKNYRELVNEANSGDYDLFVIGARGVGAIAGSRLGTVCERVVRRSAIDALVIKEPGRHLADGPLVVAVDGSPRSYGGLLTALSLASRWQVPVQVVAAFDPYFHYVAFNRIAGVLSEEASRVFRFKEQERLHEEIIDSGLAKIYEGHLSVAESIATEHGMEIEPVLLDGKPHDAIEKHLRKVRPSLLVVGKLGIHADPELDIGGNAENLLRNGECAVLLSQRQYQPRTDVVADVTTSWTQEAERRMEKAPSFVRNMARMAILRYAQERGHTVITEKIVEEATAQLMPRHAEQLMEEIVAGQERGQGAGGRGQDAGDLEVQWSEEALALLETVKDKSLGDNLRLRAEKKARQEGSPTVGATQVRAFIGDNGVGGNAPSPTPDPRPPIPDLHWHAAALARLMRVPEGFMRDASRERIEDYARERDISQITLEVAEQGLAMARKAMEEAVRERGVSGGAGETAPVPPEHATGTAGKDRCPFPHEGTSIAADSGKPQVTWSREAEARLRSIPSGFSRDMTRKAAETIAVRSSITEIGEAFLQQILDTFAAGSHAASETLAWDEDARERIARAPDMVRGMLIREIEAWARRNGMEQVSQAAVDAVKSEWQKKGVFHLDPSDPRNPEDP